MKTKQQELPIVSGDYERCRELGLQPLYPEHAGKLGHDAAGIRTFCLSDDPPNRYAGDVAAWKVLNRRPLDEWENSAMKCPQCGAVEDLDLYDICGADDGNVFCINCQAEVPIRTFGGMADEIKLAERTQGNNAKAEVLITRRLLDLASGVCWGKIRDKEGANG